MICKRCNTLNPIDAKVCETCGANLKNKDSNSNNESEKIALKPKIDSKKQKIVKPVKIKTVTKSSSKPKVNSKILKLITKKGLGIISLVIILGLLFVILSGKNINQYLLKSRQYVYNLSQKYLKISHLETLEKETEKEVLKSNKKVKYNHKKKTRALPKIKRNNFSLQTYLSTKDSMVMILIPSGAVEIGNENETDFEKPVHTIHIKAFYMDEHEVTNSQYRKFIEETGYKLPKYIKEKVFANPQQPVVGVSFKDASAYAKWAGKRLPTEEEWEKAARGGLKGLSYPFSKTITPREACYDLNTKGDSPVDVKQYKKNDYHLYDMSGNVAEWTSSLPNAYPEGKAPDKVYDDKYRIIRGGSWKSQNKHITVSRRDVKGILWKSNDVGFRTVIDY